MDINSENRIRVAKGIGTGWVLSFVFIYFGYKFMVSHGIGADNSWPRTLSLTLIPPSLSLAAGIGWAAHTRHFKQNIDGTDPAPGTPLDITLRYIRNTSEQVLLFLLMSLCLLGALPQFAHSILPVLGLWFLLARILFWTGYVRAPLSRAIGFAASFHPTLVFLCVGIIALIGS